MTSSGKQESKVVESAMGYGESADLSFTTVAGTTGKAITFPMADMSIVSTDGIEYYKIVVIKAIFSAYLEPPFGVKTVYASISGQIKVVQPYFANLAVYISKLVIDGSEYSLGPDGQGNVVVPTSQNRVGYSHVLVGEIGDKLYDGIMGGGFSFQRRYLFRANRNSIPKDLPPQP